MAVPVLVLQAFPIQRRTARRGPEQKPFGTDIAREPNQISHALKAEHRVVNVERNHVHADIRVRRSRGDKRGHRPGLVNPFFKNLPVFGFLIIKQGVAVDRIIELAFGRINTDGTKQRVHTERARFIGNNRHHAAANLRMPQKFGQDADKSHGGRSFKLARTFIKFLKKIFTRHIHRLMLCLALRHKPIQFFTAFKQVLGFNAVFGRAVKRRFHHVLIRNRHVETRPELTQLFFIHFFLLVRDVAAFARFAEAVALDRLGQNHGRLAFVFRRCLESCVNLLRIVAAARQRAQILVREMIHQS